MTLFFIAPLNEKSKEQQRVKDNLCLYICYFSKNFCFFLKIENSKKKQSPKQDRIF